MPLRRCRFAILWLWALLVWTCLGNALKSEEISAWLNRSWQTDDGLPDNSVTGLAQSADGYLWVGTRGGLLRFNGQEFTPIVLPELPGVTNRVIRMMLLDKRGRLWLGKERGRLVCLDHDKVLAFGIEDGLPDEQMTSIVEGGDEDLLVSYPNSIFSIKDGACKLIGGGDFSGENRNGFVVMDGGGGEVWYSRNSKLGKIRAGQMVDVLDLPSAPVRAYPAKGGGLWVCAGNVLYRVEAEQAPQVVGKLPNNASARVLLEDRLGALWVGTVTDGLFRFYEGEVEKIETTLPSIMCMSEDREGNLWVGTDGGGLNQIRARALVVVGQRAGSSAESVRSVCEDGSGELWTVTQGGRLARGVGERRMEMKPVGDWKGGGATCVASNHQAAVWVGTERSGLYQFSAGTWKNWLDFDGLASNAVRSLLVTGQGDVWVATDAPRRLQRLRDGVFDLVDLPSSVRSIRALAEAADGNVWVGTAEGQVLRVDADSLTAESVSIEEGAVSIRSLLATADGALWVGYAGTGVGRFKDGKWSRITTDQGLLDDYASQIFTDRQGAMWIAGNHGVFQVKLAEMNAVADGRAKRVHSRVFGRSEGLTNLQPNFDFFPAVCNASDGRIWVAMRSGLLLVQPEKITENLLSPPVVLESVAVDDRQVGVYAVGLSTFLVQKDLSLDLRSPLAVMDLKPDHEKLKIDFAALSFSSPENINFKYRLENFDSKWIDAGKIHSALYPRLPYGSYRFQVIACNDSGVWNELGAELKITVTPFFWQTWWFRIFASIGLLLVIFFFVRYVSLRRLRERMRVLKQQGALQKERARIARDMHDEVGSKLTRLSLLGEMAVADLQISDKARADVAEISETARETILAFDEIVWAVNPRNDTLADLIHYLCRHAEEFFEGSATHCVFDLPKVITPVMLPTEVRHQVFLAAKEALNNVAKHANASEVCIRLLIQTKAFELVIHDDGRGFDPGVPSMRAGGGSGLLNIQERIRGIDGRFECVIQPGQGTRIAFHIPLNLVFQKSASAKLPHSKAQ